MKELVEVIAKALVDSPDDVFVTQRDEDDGTIVLELHVSKDDMGKVIGKKGRIAKSIRTVVKTAATRKDLKVVVDIVE
ncbi:MAG: KH domain-containing protein [Lachnospiraceae bacterium]|nr:KH domain-containing protein [Lachnospiraceae bacterium]MBR6350264.1 KH domain-containing protein [Lachnospiraceae bacterium]